MQSKNDDFAWTDKNISFKESKVLIVDDITHNRTLVRTFLNRYNVELFEAENGEEAVAQAIEVMPALIFMDIRMPKMDGYDATKLIKNNALTSHIPIIALTASTMQDEISKVMMYFDSFIQKPVNKKTLLSEMVRFLPFEDFTKTTEEKPANLISEVQIEKDFKISPELKKQFSNEFLNDILSQTDSIILEDVSSLIINLETFAKNNSVDELLEITNELKSNLEDFDIDNIQRNLGLLKRIFTE